MEATLRRICSWIVYIKGIHNTVADAISRLECDPKQNLSNEYTHAIVHVPTGEPISNSKRWKTFSKRWRKYNKCSTMLNTNDIKINLVFPNRIEDDKIYPLITAEIANVQRADATYKHLFKRNAVIDQGLEVKLIENTLCVCKDGRLVIPQPLQGCAVMWYHHYLHPGHTRLEEMMNAVMYWKGMHTTIRTITKSCKSCQVNKIWNNKYRHLPAKLIISTPWEYLCVNLIGPYTLKGKDGLQIDFMALTMIDPTSSWFEITELPLVKWLRTITVNGKELLQSEEIFGKKFR
jgi:hypothetical protein